MHIKNIYFPIKTAPMKKKSKQIKKIPQNNNKQTRQNKTNQKKKHTHTKEEKKQNRQA
jgi:hypothetical protein